MPSRKSRRKGSVQEKKEINNKSIRKLIIMIVSVLIMIFSASQVYFLFKYTLGHDVSSKHLKLYKWVTLLVNGDTQEQTVEELESN